MKTPKAINQGISSITSRSEYTIYRESIAESNRIKGRQNYIDFVKDYLSTVSDLFLEYEGGVVVKDAFYMFAFMCPTKTKYRLQSNMPSRFNYHTNHHYYNIAIMMPSRHNHWGFVKRTLPEDKRKKFVENLRKGLKYKSYLSSVKKSRLI